MSCAQDSTWGPASTCRPLDFTLFFEQSILFLTTDVIFLVLVGFRLFYLHSQPNKLAHAGKAIVTAKCLTALLVVASTTTSLAYFSLTRTYERTSLGVVAPTFQFTASLPLTILVLAEHFKSQTPSMLIICYALLKALFTGAALRTYVLIDLFHTAYGAAVASALVTASFSALFCVELVEKRRLLRTKTLPKVATSSFLSSSLYLWLIPLLWNGRKKAITAADYGSIPEDLGAQSTRLRLERALQTTAKTEPRYLVIASLKSFGLLFLAPVLPRIALLLATFAQPLLVTQTISFVSDPKRVNDQGWALVGGFVCVFMMIALTTSLYWEKVFDATVAYRGALVGTIYNKTLKVSASASRTLGGGVASTYMSVDVERVCQGAELIHELWASLVSVVIAIVLLYYQATWPAFLPVIVTVFLLIAATHIGRSVGRSQAVWLAATDRRVKYISSVINNFLPMKWSRYEEVLAKHAAHLRKEEMEGAGTFYRGLVISAALSNTAAVACTLSVLGPYAAISARNGISTLDANSIFTIVTTVNLLSSPLNLLGQVLPDFAAAYSSLLRIQGYLLLDEVEERPQEQRQHPYEEIKSEKMAVREVAAVHVDAASFAWSPNAGPFLKDISVQLNEPKLYVLVGSIASGKSLLLLSLLGETTRTSGNFTTNCSLIAYAEQDALIVSGSIRENITFGQPFVQDWYDRVVEACALTTDIRKLKAGDGTFLGEKGTRLSGGQRQRVGLARAVYADAPLTLLDDPFSALDSHTEAHVFQSLFGPTGLLKGKMTVLVTHNLKHLYSADKVIVLNAGKVQYQGTLSDIQESGYNGLKDTGKSRVHAEEEGVVSKADEHVEEAEDAEAPIAESSLGLTPYIFFGKMGGKMNMITLPTLFTAIGICRLGLQLYLRQWSASDGTNLGAWIGGYSGLMVVFLVLIGASFWYFAHVITARIGQGVHAAEINGLFATSPSYVMVTSAGRIINRFSQDIFMCDFEFPVSFLNWMLSLVQLVGTVVFILVPVPWLALSIIPLGLIYHAALRFYLASSKQLQHLEASSKSPMYTLFSTTVSGLLTIRALNVERHFMNQNEVYVDNSQKPFYFRFGGVRFLRTLLAFISAVLAIGLAALAVGLRHSTNPSSLGLALSSVTSLTNLLSNLLLELSKVENSSVSISRIHEMVTLPAENDPAASENTPPPSSPDAGTWPTNGAVTFKDVRLRYRAGLDTIVKGVSFSIAAGQKVGICGRSGSGKSSLIMALFRALDASLMEGTIEIDNIDIQSLPLETLRSSFSLVAQDPFLWNSSLRHNLDPHGHHTEDEVWMSLKRVGMGDAVSALPDKLESILEDGGSISKGQRQLICLARVLLRQRRIVILDEASSSLDLETDEQMRRVIKTDLADCTVIAVAHRLATISDFDLILVMDDGLLIESGAPQDLLGEPNSTFAQLAARQGLRLH